MSVVFSPDEDSKLKELISIYGDKDFKSIRQHMPHRSTRELRRRYVENLKDYHDDTSWSDQEDDLLIEMYRLYGGKWSKICSYFKTKSQNSVKNRYNHIIKKQAMREERSIDDVLPTFNLPDPFINSFAPTNEDEKASQANQNCQLGNLLLQADRLVDDDDFKTFEGETANGDKIAIPQIMNQYRFNAPLGSGGFSMIAHVINIDTSEEYAAKIIPKKRINANIYREVGFLKFMNHDNIIKYYEHFCTDDDKYLIIIMDLCDQDLFTYIFENKDNFEALKEILFGIASAIQYLHHNHIAHLDIKPENILIKNGRPLISDFGLSNFHLVCPMAFVRHGTDQFAGPECFCNKQIKVNAFKIDIYALGLIFYICATGDGFLYSANSIQVRLYYGLKMNESDPLQHLAKLCTLNDPKCRPTIDEVLNHKYFQC